LTRLLALLALLAIGCDLAVTLPRAPAPAAPVPGAVETIVVQTAAAAATQTATVLTPTATLTNTPVPTRTASVTPTFTPTFIIRLTTREPTNTTAPTDQSQTETTGDFACTQVSQSPNDNAHFARKESFSVAWRVKNTGTADWKANSVDFGYVSGAKMYETSLYDLTNNVRVGNTLNLVVDMVAPKNPGTYTTVWSLRQSTMEFCEVDLKIVVP
jgi:hypothetical protein